MNFDQDSIHQSALEKAFISLNSKMGSIVNTQYQKEVEELDGYYQDKSKLPSKIGLSEAANSAFDKNRILFICRALRFFQTYYATGKTPLKSPLVSLEKEAWDNLCLMNSRHLLEHIAFTIFNLSGALKGVLPVA